MATVFTLAVMSGTLSFGKFEMLQRKAVVSRNVAPPNVTANNQDVVHSTSSKNMSGTLSFGNPETMQHKTVVSRNAAPPDVIPDSQYADHSASSADSLCNTWTIVGVVIAAIGVVMQLVAIGHNQYLQRSRDEKDRTRRGEEETARHELENRQEKAANLRKGEIIQSLMELKLALSNLGQFEFNSRQGCHRCLKSSFLDVPDVPDVQDVPNVPDVQDIPDVLDVPDVSDIPDAR